MISTNQTLQESHASAITMPAAQSPEDNIALIGGVVGGAVALLSHWRSDRVLRGA
jgi:hypothetical protein